MTYGIMVATTYVTIPQLLYCHLVGVPNVSDSETVSRYQCILVPQTSQSMPQVDCESADVAKLRVRIDNLLALCNSLPSSVPEATDSDF